MEQPIIFRHDSKPEWGNAIIAWQRGPKRGYQFEDGKLRVFKRGWYDRMTEVDMPAPKALATSERLQRKLGLTPRRVAASSFDGISFDDQLVLFEHYYPGGFSGDAWQKHFRGLATAKRVKRHRDAAIDEARETLSAERLDAWIAAGEHDAAWTAIVGVLRATDLVTGAHTKPLAGADESARRELVIRARELLWGDDAYEVRFERWIAALALVIGKPPSWQLATALSALVHPHAHACIRPGAVRAQASWLAPRLRLSNTPSAPLYVRMLRMIDTVRAELTDAGDPPRDLLDVHDFMWTTLRPKARKELDAVKAAAHESEAA